VKAVPQREGVERGRLIAESSALLLHTQHVQSLPIAITAVRGPPPTASKPDCFPQLPMPASGRKHALRVTA